MVKNTVKLTELIAFYLRNIPIISFFACLSWVPLHAGLDATFAYPGDGYPSAMAVSSGRVYIADSGSIWRYVESTGVWANLTNSGYVGRAYAVATDGTYVYVGGTLTSVGSGGLSVNSIAKYQIATGIWSALGTGANNGILNNISGVDYQGSVWTIAIEWSYDSLWGWAKRVFIGGYFNKAGGALTSNNITSYVETGNAWVAMGTGLSGGDNGPWCPPVASIVTRLVYIAPNYYADVYASGNFSQTSYGGSKAYQIAKYSSYYSLWFSFGSGIQGYQYTAYPDCVYQLRLPTYHNWVGALTAAPDGTIYLGGNELYNINGTRNHDCGTASPVCDTKWDSWGLGQIGAASGVLSPFLDVDSADGSCDGGSVGSVLAYGSSSNPNLLVAAGNFSYTALNVGGSYPQIKIGAASGYLLARVGGTWSSVPVPIGINEMKNTTTWAYIVTYGNLSSGISGGVWRWKP